MAVAQPEGAAEHDPGSESIEELFLALETPLLCYARRLAVNDQMAEDLVQEAFMRLQTQFDQVRSPRSWLYRTVHNLALNQRRHDDKIVPLASSSSTDEPQPAADLPDTQPLPDEQIAHWEGIGLIRLNLKNLDARTQEIIRLKFVEGLAYKEIAQKTGLSQSNVGYILHHSLKSLAADLAKAGLVP